MLYRRLERLYGVLCSMRGLLGGNDPIFLVGSLLGNPKVEHESLCSKWIISYHFRGS